MLDDGKNIKNHNALRSKIVEWSFYMVILFFISFFAGTKIYQISMTVNASEVNKSSSSTRVDSSDMNKREAKTKTPPISVIKSTSNEVFNPYKENGKKIAYLTFDDGPSKNNTPQILSILEKNKINATFFVIGNLAEENSNLVKKEYLDGNVIGNHTYSHVYNQIYSSTQNFEQEIRKNETVLKSILGDSYKTKLIRFPGGSFGAKLKPFRDVILKDGYHYVDWNALDGDAEGTNIAPDKLFQRLKETVGNQQHVVILMHDTSAKNTTVQILPQVIKYLSSKGYSFDILQ